MYLIKCMASLCQYLKSYIKFQICHGKTKYGSTNTYIKRKLKRTHQFTLKINVSKLLTYRQTLSDGNKHSYKHNGVPKKQNHKKLLKNKQMYVILVIVILILNQLDLDRKI